jgi:Putative DNA-binding domain
VSGTTDFHARWLAAIDARRAGKVPDIALPGIAQPGFAVYANTGLMACADALEANFPAVAGRLGARLFRPMAIRFARLHPARDARLFQYGEGFAGYLSACEHQDDEAVLPELAQLDRMWMQAHVAADAAPLDHRHWAAQDPAALASAALLLAPATHWHCHARLPIWDQWSTARGIGLDRSPAPRQGQAVLITRPADAVLACELNAAGCAFLQACEQGMPLADAAEAALQRAPETDLQALLSLLFAQGAFAERAESESIANPSGNPP